MKILFKVFPQKSHLNATFPLARTLRERGHDVVYAGVEPLRRHVEAQDHRYHGQAEDLFPYVEPKRGDPKLTFRTMLQNWYRNRAWADGLRAKYARCTAFDALVKDVQPDLVLVDSPYTFFALGLFRLGVPFAVLESMVNLGWARGFPPGDTTCVPCAGWIGRLCAAAHWRRYFAKRWFMGALGFRVDFAQSFVLQTARAGGVSRNELSFERYFHLGLTTVPELILSPREFDFPRPAAKNQVYIGPSVEMNREESAGDYRFAGRFSQLVEARTRGTPLVYCCLGTAAWRYDGVERFLARIVEAARGAQWHLLLAVGTELELRLPPARPKNVDVFQVVPQLQVLRHADVMVTHGGMNSITECLLAGVPMVVFPGTTQIDQAGNAARVAYHRLGLMGNLQRASAVRIRRSVDQILRDPEYRRRVGEMGRRIRESEAYVRGAEILFEALRRHFPNLHPPDSARSSTLPDPSSHPAERKL
jgi:UDP:flavonoid glycosyltransferase YjiC (YdhE family)